MCSIHELRAGQPGKMLRTGLHSSKSYQVLNVNNGEITSVILRSEIERKNSAQIEADKKIGNCTRCRVFTEVTNYFLVTRNGGGNVNICHNCKYTHFANKSEKICYILQKLSFRLGDWIHTDPLYSNLFNY